MANNKMSIEQFEAFAKTLPEGSDKRKVARALGLELPVEVKPLAEQLGGVVIVKHTPKAAKGKQAVEKEYVSVPNLQLNEEEGTRGFWLRASVARAVAESILKVCDTNNL